MSLSGNGALVRLNDNADFHLVETAFIARKRVKVVQLLIFGKSVVAVACVSSHAAHMIV